MSQTTVEINGVKFRITPFDPFKQLELFGNLQREILPAVGGVLNVAFAGDNPDEKTDAAAIAAFRDLSSNFSGDVLKKWAHLLINEELVTYELAGEVQKLNAHRFGEAFTDFSMILELMYHIGKVNFADPLQRWAGLSGLAQKLTAKLSANSGQTSKAK